MSSLRVVNNSPETERRRLMPEEEVEAAAAAAAALSSPTSNLSGSAAFPSHEPPSMFDDIPEEARDGLFTENNAEVFAERGGLGYPVEEEEDLDSYNLKPPPPTHTQQLHSGLEALTDRLLSPDHLDLILKDHALAARFTRFLQTYRPAQADTLRQYAEARKAIAAVEYANAVANQMMPQAGHPPLVAAKLDERFESHSKHSVGVLVEEALAAYLTHRLVVVVTDTLVKEITGNSAPMHQLIPSLAEVYCISDPSTKDNPIVYASEEFYNITQYSKEFTIGRNCRFLQGPKSSGAAVARLIQALSRGEECCETILNYKRDGTPFMNLLMIAPLYDNKGAVRYFLGCQIDVSSLIEGGRGLESFAQLLSQDRAEARAGGYGSYNDRKRDPKTVLSDFGQLLTDEEAEIVRNRAHKANVISSEGTDTMVSSSSRHLHSRSNTRSGRIVLGMDSNPTPPPERQLWPSATLGPSGRLPGVYQNYLLVRPYPSLRITFTSPSLRIPGLLQTKLLDRIGGPQDVREGLLDALSRGVGVTAKVSWLVTSTNINNNNTNTNTTTNYSGVHSADYSNNNNNNNIPSGRTRWLHCTPLLGSDERVGVWMIVICEDEDAMSTGSLRRGTNNGTYFPGGGSIRGARSVHGQSGAGAQNFTRSKLYADYLRREGRDNNIVGGGGAGFGGFGSGSGFGAGGFGAGSASASGGAGGSTSRPLTAMTSGSSRVEVQAHNKNRNGNGNGNGHGLGHEAAFDRDREGQERREIDEHFRDF